MRPAQHMQNNCVQAEDRASQLAIFVLQREGLERPTNIVTAQVEGDQQEGRSGCPQRHVPCPNWFAGMILLVISQAMNPVHADMIRTPEGQRADQNGVRAFSPSSSAGSRKGRKAIHPAAHGVRTHRKSLRRKVVGMSLSPQEIERIERRMNPRAVPTSGASTRAEKILLCVRDARPTEYRG